MVGGWIRILVWCAAIQSAVGFTSAYAIILATLAQQFNYLPPQALQLMMNLTYVLIIIPALGSGFAITIHSWIAFAREKSLANLGMAGWNTFAQAYNTYNAVQNFGAAFSNVSESLGGLFSGDSDSDDASTMRVLILVAIALLGGVLTTAAIVQKTPPAFPVSEARPQRRLPGHPIPLIILQHQSCHELPQAISWQLFCGRRIKGLCRGVNRGWRARKYCL